jgi:hypothetical protein
MHPYLVGHALDEHHRNCFKWVCKFNKWTAAFNITNLVWFSSSAARASISKGDFLHWTLLASTIPWICYRATYSSGFAWYRIICHSCGTHDSRQDELRSNDSRSWLLVIAGKAAFISNSILCQGINLPCASPGRSRGTASWAIPYSNIMHGLLCCSRHRRWHPWSKDIHPDAADFYELSRQYRCPLETWCIDLLDSKREKLSPLLSLSISSPWGRYKKYYQPDLLRL